MSHRDYTIKKRNTHILQSNDLNHILNSQQLTDYKSLTTKQCVKSINKKFDPLKPSTLQNTIYNIIPKTNNAIVDNASLNTSYKFTGTINYFQIFDQYNRMISPISATNGYIIPYSESYSEIRGMPREPFNQVSISDKTLTNFFGTSLTYSLEAGNEYIGFRFRDTNTNTLYNATISGENISISGEYLLYAEKQDNIISNSFTGYGTITNPIRFNVNIEYAEKRCPNFIIGKDTNERDNRKYDKNLKMFHSDKRKNTARQTYWKNKKNGKNKPFCLCVT